MNNNILINMVIPEFTKKAGDISEEEFEAAFRKMLNNKSDYVEWGFDEINAFIDEANKKSETNYNNTGSLYSGTYVKKIPKFRAFSPEVAAARAAISDKARKICENIYVEAAKAYYNRRKSGVDIDSDRSMHAVLRCMKVSPEEYLKYTTEQKKDMFKNMVKESERVAKKYSKDLTDDQMMQDIEEDIEFVNMLADLDGNKIDAIRHYMKIDGEDPELSAICDSWKKDYTMICQNVNSYVIPRLGLISNPYYKIFDENYFKAFCCFVNELAMDQFEDKSIIRRFNLLEGGNVKENDWHLKNFVDYKSSAIFIFSSVSADITKNINDVSFNNDIIYPNLKEQLREKNLKAEDVTFTVISEDDLATKYTLSEEQNSDPVKAAACSLANGSKVVLTDKAGKVMEIKVSVSGNISFAEPQIPDLTKMSAKDFKSEVKTYINGLSSVDRFVYKPTKEFTSFAKNLSKLGSINIDKNYDKYMDTLTAAVKDAQAYIHNKRVTDKPFTDKTYKRIKFAEDFVKRFEGAKEFKKVMENAEKVKEQYKSEDFPELNSAIADKLQGDIKKGSAGNIKKDNVKTTEKVKSNDEITT